jgi:hypothetical protein
MDMKSSNISMSCPEFGILKVAMAQIGKSLDLPIRMPAMLRDAKALDAQTGFETGMIGTVTGMIADLMDGMQLGMDLVVDFPDLIFCDDCMAAIRRMAATLVIDENTLALETMKEVGPGAHFSVRIIPSSTFARNCGCPGCWNVEIGIYGKKTALGIFSKLLREVSMNCWPSIRNRCCRQKSNIKSMRLLERHRVSRSPL